MRIKILRRFIILAIVLCFAFAPANVAFANDLGIEFDNQISNDNVLSSLNSRNVLTRGVIQAGNSGNIYPRLGGFVVWRDFVVNAVSEDSSSTITLHLYDPNGMLKYDWTQSGNDMTVHTVYWLPAGEWRLNVDASNSSCDVEIAAGWRE